jgi:hypothetical protein
MRNTDRDKGRSKMLARIDAARGVGATFAVVTSRPIGLTKKNKKAVAVATRSAVKRRARAHQLAASARHALSSCSYNPRNLHCMKPTVPTLSGFEDIYGRKLYCCMPPMLTMPRRRK